MSHKATVTISGINNDITVDPNPLKPKGQRDLEWTITTKGWEFCTPKAITIPTNNGEFTDLSPSDNNRKCRFEDADTNTRSYAYTINVQPVGQPRLAKHLDPMIDNGDSK
jgi:hypothetical protein